MHQTQYLKPVDSQQYYIIILLFVETPCKFITKLSICKPDLISTDEDPGLGVESFAVINLCGVSTNNSIICFIAMPCMFYCHAFPNVYSV